MTELKAVKKAGRGNNWNFASWSLKGQRHREKNMQCQDQVGFYRKGQVEAVSLLDGTGKTNRNATVVRKIADFVCRYLVEHFEEILEADPQFSKITLMLEIRQLIEEYMEKYQMAGKEFSSTLMVAAVNHEKNTYLGFHLGDGMVLCERSDDASVFRMVSGPKNGLFRNQTILTTSSMAAEEMEIFRGSLDHVESFVLLSDGIYQTPVVTENLCSFIYKVAQGQDIMEEKEDDQSILLLSRQPLL